jgi:hemerythrin superfamily protein
MALGVNEMTVLSRRNLAVGAVALTTAAVMRGAIAQTMSRGGTWLDMVKAHHALIAGAFDKILATNDSQAAERAALQRTLAYLLTAHSVAEENVLYPALTKFGMTSASDRLYAEQAQAKVINADLGWSPTGDASWLQQATAMRTAVLHHAKDEEEGDLFPKLQRAAGPLNAKLTAGYAREFARVEKT